MRLARTGRRSKPRPEKGNMPGIPDDSDFCERAMGVFDTFSDSFMINAMHEKKEDMQGDR
jgi:hypothetical protein